MRKRTFWPQSNHPNPGRELACVRNRYTTGLIFAGERAIRSFSSGRACKRLADNRRDVYWPAGINSFSATQFSDNENRRRRTERNPENHKNNNNNAPACAEPGRVSADRFGTKRYGGNDTSQSATSVVYNTNIDCSENGNTSGIKRKTKTHSRYKKTPSRYVYNRLRLEMYLYAHR